MEYGLLGEKLGHSFSPQIHGQLASYEYGLIEKKPEDVEAFLREKKFRGLNVTIPYKKTVLEFCDEISELAGRIGSINTIANRDGILYGDNTDYSGFRYMVRKLGVPVKGKKALILGNGGAAPAVRAALEDEQAGQIVIISRRGEDNYENLSRHADARILVNTTPLGMYPNNGKVAVDLERFPHCEAAFDLIYNPLRTRFLLDAERLGIPCMDGLAMLVAQAKKSCEIFLDQEIPDEEIERIREDLYRNVRNVCLIGMPGSGKTTVGRELARRLGKKFVDIDREIVRREGKEIPEIFSESGEEGFRRVETSLLAQVTKESGQVIATGGGVVVRPENRELLRQNGVVIFLERDLKELETEGRPISLSRPLSQIYEERKDAYHSWSDFQVKNVRVKNAVEEIFTRL